MTRILALARITWLNGRRRHAVWGLFAFALALEAAGFSFADFFGHDLGRAASDWVFSIMWMAGLLFTLFYAVRAVAWDENHRVIDSILAHPVSRGEYVLGMALGLWMLALTLEAALGLVGLGVLAWMRHSIDPAYFPHFSTARFALAWLGLQAALAMMLAALMLFSGLLRGAFPVLLSMLAWLLTGSGIPVVEQSLQRMAERGHPAPVLQGIVHWLGAAFPNPGRLDFKDAVVSARPLPDLGLDPAWALALALLYAAVALALAIALYERRDIY